MKMLSYLYSVGDFFFLLHFSSAFWLVSAIGLRVWAKQPKKLRRLNPRYHIPNGNEDHTRMLSGNILFNITK